MLPKANRLRRNQDFSKVYEKGIRQNGPDLVLRALRCPAESRKTVKPTRIGISIGKKVSKQAVVRNRLKRLIRAAVRQLLLVPNHHYRSGLQLCLYRVHQNTQYLPPAPPHSGDRGH